MGKQKENFNNIGLQNVVKAATMTDPCSTALVSLAAHKITMLLVNEMLYCGHT